MWRVLAINVAAVVFGTADRASSMCEENTVHGRRKGELITSSSHRDHESAVYRFSSHILSELQLISLSRLEGTVFRFIWVALAFGSAAFFIVEVMRWHWDDDSMFTEPYVSVWFLLGELIGGIFVQMIIGLVVGVVFFALSPKHQKVRRGIISSTITTTIVTSLMLVGVYGHRTERLSVESAHLRGTL